jgi:pyrroline-5-carboxylate reductase
MAKLVFIGAGNMARSLIGGLLQNGHPAADILATDPSEATRSQLSADFGVQVGDDNLSALASAETVVLAVKPQVMREVVESLSAAAAETQPLFISIAAGVRECDIHHWLGFDAAIVRCMPNTPALLRAGATALYANANVDADQRSRADELLAAAGYTCWVDTEAQIDAVTALSGSGPAYFFAVLEAMEKAAVQLGLPADMARQLAIETSYGAARMARESGDEPAVLRQKVTSKGGTTAAALEAFAAGGLDELFANAMRAACQRAESLGRELGSD